MILGTGVLEHLVYSWFGSHGVDICLNKFHLYIAYHNELISAVNTHQRREER